jgi:hypothetical protein
MHPRRPRRLLSSASLGAVLLALSGFTAGCGSSSDHRAADPFVGRWELDPDSDSFTLSSCSDNYFDGAPLYIWNEAVFEYGELTDLTETSGSCITLVTSAAQNTGVVPGLGYDVSGDTAKLPDKDPYSGDAQLCILQAGTDPNGNTVVLQLSPDPKAWQFQLQAKASGQPRRADLGGGTVKASIDVIDSTAQTMTNLATCNMTGAISLFRVSTE